MEESDGLKRAKWVDCSIRPKKRGEFEGCLKGEPGRIRRYLWTGRRWMFWRPTVKAHWAPSVFGQPGDKWRGLAEDPYADSKPEEGHSLPEGESPAEVVNLQPIAKTTECEDEGCQHYGTPHSHPPYPNTARVTDAQNMSDTEAGVSLAG